MWIYAYTHVCGVFRCVHVHVGECMCVSVWHGHTGTCVHVLVCVMCTHVHTRTNVHMHVRM
jgi:hypothetical protein